MKFIHALLKIENNVKIVEIKDNSENTCLEENGNEFIKIRNLVTRRTLKMDFPKLEMFS